MACSQPYLDLVKTTSGYTPSAPYERLFGIELPTSGAYEEWRELAYRLRDTAFTFLYALGDIETALGRDGYPRYQAMRELYTPINDKINELDTAWSEAFQFDSMTWSGLISRASNLAADMACLIETISTEIANYGGKAPTLPTIVADKGGPGGGGLGIIGTVIAVGVAGALVYGGIKLSRRGDAGEAS